MNKNSALARGVRTFVALLAGVAPTWAAINLATDFQSGATKIGLGVVAAVIGGLLAFLYALSPGTNANTPFMKAVATFIEGVVSGLGTFTLAALTVSEFERLGAVLVTVVGASFTSAIITLVTNSAEDAVAAP